jgi:hypothetical protein
MFHRHGFKLNACQIEVTQAANRETPATTANTSANGDSPLPSDRPNTIAAPENENTSVKEDQAKRLLAGLEP